jgi:hypothetical protein
MKTGGFFAQTIAGRCTEAENYTEELSELLFAVLAVKHALGMFAMTQRNGLAE